MSLDLEAFDAFYRAVNVERGPFAWQRRLVAHLLEHRRWPRRIDAPTGSGKTAVIEAHVFAVAALAAETDPRRKPPRRLSLVVDRRALVDDQHRRATVIADLLAQSTDGRITAVRDGLRALSPGTSTPGASPLQVVLMRGGAPGSFDWRNDPLACTIICATPAMWGSRLLMRGYGTSQAARPHEAGLLAYDSVVIVDEAHLARQLVRTAGRITALEAFATQQLPAQVLQVVELSATPPEDGELASTVGVVAGDLEGPARSAGDALLARRLLTPKPARIVSAPADQSTAARRGLAELIAGLAIEAREQHGPTVACVVNTVPLALEVRRSLEGRTVAGRTVSHVILTGRQRPYDIDVLRAEHPGLFSIEGDPSIDVVVATQTIEVGVDMDFVAMVTELAPGSALSQRAGRVNRIGARETAEVIVVAPADPATIEDAPPYRQDELRDGLEWIVRRADDPAGLAPWSVATDRPPDAVLRRTLLQRLEIWDAWVLARTDQDLVADPDPELWLDDELEQDRDVTIVFRDMVADADGNFDVTANHQLVAATPPRANEGYPVRIGLARQLVADAVQPDGRRNASREHDASPVFLVRRPDDIVPCSSAGEVRPGVTLIAATSRRWLRGGVVDGAGESRSTDVLEEPMPARITPADPARRTAAPFVLRIAAGMPAVHGVSREAIQDFLADAAEADPTAGQATELEEDDAEERLKRVPRRVLDFLQSVVPDSPKAAELQRLIDAGQPLGSYFAKPVEAGPPAWLLIRELRGADEDEQAAQEASPRGRAVTLQAHQDAVATRAKAIGEALHLGPLVDDLEWAGRLHDEGKQDPRFQRSLGRSGVVPYAKSGMRDPAYIKRMRAGSGLPRGWRHEQLSAAYAWAEGTAWSDEVRDLVARLVGTSHGHGRGAFGHGAADLTPDVHVDDAKRLFEDGEWDAMLERTHARFGVWGCAYLEALLRAADCTVSGEGG